MPAGSERSGAPALPHTWRPLGPRLAALVFGLVLVGAFAYLWLGFSDETRQQVNWLQRVTVVAMVLAGLALLYALARSRVTATARGLTVVNGYRKREFEWAEVVAVRFPPGAPWPTLDLADGTTVSVMGIHGSDGERARLAVRQMRVLLAGSGPGQPNL